MRINRVSSTSLFLLILLVSSGCQAEFVHVEPRGTEISRDVFLERLDFLATSQPPMFERYETIVVDRITISRNDDFYCEEDYQFTLYKQHEVNSAIVTKEFYENLDAQYGNDNIPALKNWDCTVKQYYFDEGYQIIMETKGTLHILFDGPYKCHSWDIIEMDLEGKFISQYSKSTIWPEFSQKGEGTQSITDLRYTWNERNY